jgi:hypothetical protein
MLAYTHAAPTTSSAGINTRSWNSRLVEARDGAGEANGLAATEARFKQLTERKKSMEMESQAIPFSRMMLTNSISALRNQTAVGDQREGIAKLQSQEKQLEITCHNLGAQYQAVIKEMEAVAKILHKDIGPSSKITC